MLVPGFVLMQAGTAWRIARRERVEVIHAHWLLPQGLIAVVLKLLAGRRTPFLVTSHGADLFTLTGRFFGLLKRVVVDEAAAVTVVSDAMREQMSRMGVDVRGVHVKPMGVDLNNRFFPDRTVPRSNTELLFVGRLVEKKGLKYLLDAMPAVLARRPDTILTVVGFGPDRVALEERASQLNLRGRVRFLGSVPQNQLPALYRRAAVLVAPFIRAESGDQEGLGLVLIEAIGCGCPVLAGDVPAVRDVLGVASSSYVDSRQTPELAKAIIEVLDDPELAARGAERLREDLLEKSDWTRVANGYINILEGCCPRRAAEEGL